MPTLAVITLGRAPMTIPRSKLIDAENPGYYHLYARCVRGAWLCGDDPVSGRSFGHRRQWIEDRLLFLCRHFAVELYAFAILSNHYHAIVRLDPRAPDAWPDRDVAERWLVLFPVRAGAGHEARHALRLESILGNPTLLERYRRRLGSISWLMRLLNEYTARRANREDGCKGRFWERRFGSQALLDDGATITATAYVDLNPVRAKLASAPLSAPHTSIRLRLATLPAADDDPDDRLPPLATGIARPGHGLPIGLTTYCELLSWTAANERAPPNTPSLRATLDRVGGAETWPARLRAMRHRDWRAFGGLSALRQYCRTLGQRWLRGMEEARRLERTPDATASEHPLRRPRAG